MNALNIYSNYVGVSEKFPWDSLFLASDMNFYDECINNRIPEIFFKKKINN